MPTSVASRQRTTRSSTSGRTAGVRRNPDTQQTQRQWEAYRHSHDPEIRQELLKRYLPLVRNVAGRMADRSSKLFLEVIGQA